MYLIDWRIWISFGAESISGLRTFFSATVTMTFVLLICVIICADKQDWHVMSLSYSINKVYTFITWWTNNIMQASQLHGSRPNGNETSLDNAVLIVRFLVRNYTKHMTMLVQLLSWAIHQTRYNVLLRPCHSWYGITANTEQCPSDLHQANTI